MRIASKTSEKLKQVALHISKVQDDILEASAIALQMYYDKLLKYHFTSNSNYKPLTPAYKKQKDKKYPGRPILVATGELRDRTLRTGRVVKYKKSVKLVFNLPEYGQYVMIERDFLTPTSEDFVTIINRITKECNKIQRKRARIVNGK